MSQQMPPPVTWEEKFRIAFNLAQFPALSVLPFLRSQLGYRTLAMGRILGMGVVLFLVGNPFDDGSFAPATPAHVVTVEDIANPNFDVTVVPMVSETRPATGRGYLGVFAVLMVVIAASERSHRRKELERGVPRHSYDRGKSIFSFLKLKPATLEHYVDPAFCMVAGLVIAQSFSTALGAWLFISGLCLRFVEVEIGKRQFDQNLDVIDAAIDSGTLGEVVERYETPRTRAYETEQAEIIHATLSPDVEALIARRKKPAALKEIKATPPSLTFRQRFWRLFWGRRAYAWWQKRKSKTK